MPRNHAPGPSTLRNRNRVTNKTRLRIIRGNIDADSLAFDEDEEKARVVSTAGVDAEDANEHHLQAVLSAASQRNQAKAQRVTRGADKAEKPQDAYIPIPDSTGVVEEYERWYIADRWKDPHSYIKTSETVEETIADSIVHGFTYLMDERDKEWLDKNNEEARGEGTSAQGAVSTNGTTTRLSQRSSKAKGKEPDVSLPIAISEDEFELVIGLFEKATHERTEFLHHGLEQGTPFPPFPDYQDAFAAPLGPDIFAAFTVPAWVPQPQTMLRFARVIYPYWKERRLERNGHRIISVLNYDESDVKNESYICFRRRDVKTMRKTRASQASSSEKLIRLQREFAEALEMARAVHVREQAKRELNSQAKVVWDRREDFVGFKRKFPLLGGREDEELLYDKERVMKKPKSAETSAGRIGLKLSRAREIGDIGSPIGHAESTIRPKERAAKLQAQVDQEMARMKERDHHWEDGVDSSYQLRPVEFASRHFQYFPSPELTPDSGSSSSSSASSKESPRQWRAVRTRRGRGGVLRVDRRIVARTSSAEDDEPVTLPRRPQQLIPDDPSDAQELSWRIRERWKFDHDDEPPVDPEGTDEQDRTLVDEYHMKYLLRSMTFFREDDHQRLTTDPTLFVLNSEGRMQGIVPYRLGLNPALRRDNFPSAVPARPHITQTVPLQLQQASLGLSMPQTNGTPISMQAQLKQKPPSLSIPQLRISSNGGMRPPATPAVAPIQSPSHPTTPSQPDRDGSLSSPAPAVNGVEHESSRPPPSGPVQLPEAPMPHVDTTSTSMTPMPVKPPTPHHPITIPNTYHMSGFTPSLPNGGYTYPTAQSQVQPPALTAQQLQSLRAAYNLPDGVHANRAASFIGHVVPGSANYTLPIVNGGQMGMVGMSLKIPQTRQMQWAAAQGGAEAQVPTGVAIAHSLSPHLHSPVGQQTVPPVPSPSMHHQQAVGSVGQGY